MRNMVSARKEECCEMRLTYQRHNGKYGEGDLGTARNQGRRCPKEIWRQQTEGRLVIAYVSCPRTWT